ncbi:NAD(P)/FAD-dependent oxidoreductase [Neomicrococcus aestuarii]|uniref:FAD-dependent oxidoreductase n=1 Tax=Neomicrococcus aestuarii TaxID=556325 RepID=A0A1L2ZPG2_9MICC|nr:FAD-binding oxidoreductase [Neomicrococcus aestuarii]APF41315.1 FAD-dependent oxidoreductase [Neomicrococcus aestuarii]
MPVNGNVSFWFTQTGLPVAADELAGDATADVVIVGAGYTGLWTAYYLKKARPDLTIRILESRFAGFGASGRNGGWLANTITGGRLDYEKQYGHEKVARFQEILNESIDEVIAVTRREGIDADIVKGGELLVARNPAQLARLESYFAEAQRWPEDAVLMDALQTKARVNVSGAMGGMHIPHCARIHPAKLVVGLARKVRELGVHLHENTTVLEIKPGEAVTDRGTVRAPRILRATEGFTANLKGLHREWLPMNSSMIVTEPLTPEMWDQIGWNGKETLEDMAHAYVYLQRTEDGRIAIGGRGVPYRFGSKTDTDGTTQDSTIELLNGILVDMFPAVAGTRIDHAWSGVLGVPRDWKSTVSYDPETGLGWAGGYVGTGVTATNLAGRTLRDLVLGEQTEITTLPWVNRKVRKWEVEPLRWVAVQAMYAMYYRADAAEKKSGHAQTALLARVADAVSGRGH